MTETPGYVRFWIEHDTEFAMLVAQDFRDAMNERDELRAEVERLRIELHRVSERALHLPTKQEQEIERLRTALQGIADNPDPLDGKCYCRWSQGVAKQALSQT